MNGRDSWYDKKDVKIYGAIQNFQLHFHIDYLHYWEFPCQAYPTQVFILEKGAGSHHAFLTCCFRFSCNMVYDNRIIQITAFYHYGLDVDKYFTCINSFHVHCVSCVSIISLLSSMHSKIINLFDYHFIIWNFLLIKVVISYSSAVYVPNKKNDESVEVLVQFLPYASPWMIWTVQTRTPEQRTSNSRIGVIIKLNLGTGRVNMILSSNMRYLQLKKSRKFWSSRYMET